MTAAPVDLQQTSSSVASRRGRGRTVALRAGLLPGTVFGTNAGIPGVTRWADHLPLITTTPAIEPTQIPSIADEVRDLRDEVCAHGLTRRDVARAVGVDRRSLSGWVSGEIRPSADRVRVLRSLACLVADIAVERPGRVRDVLLARRGGRALIDRVADEGTRLLQTWRPSIRPEAKVSVRVRPQNSAEPIWAAAARALVDGWLTPPTWERSIRPDATYEVDLDEASAFEEDEPGVRRRSYQ